MPRLPEVHCGKVLKKVSGVRKGQEGMEQSARVTGKGAFHLRSAALEALAFSLKSREAGTLLTSLSNSAKSLDRIRADWHGGERHRAGPAVPPE